MKTPVHISEIAPEVWYEGTEREICGRSLCDVGGRAKVGVGFAYETGPLALEGGGIPVRLVRASHASSRRRRVRPASRKLRLCFPAGQRFSRQVGPGR
jgi:hypothetical protein